MTGTTRPGAPPRRVRVSGDLFHGRVPDGAVYVGRGCPGLPASPWANPHRVGPCRPCGCTHNQADAVRAYAHDLAARPDLIAAARCELAGVDLACWCRPDIGPCHADLLLAVVTGTEPLAAYQALLAATSTGSPRPRHRSL
jgi:hypothetical protein